MENNNKNNGPNKNRQGWGIILFTTLLVTFVVMGLYSMMQGGSASEISYDKFLKLVDNGKVESVTFTNSRINIVLTDDARKEKAEGKLTEVKDNEKASADQSDSSDSKESEDQENVMDSLLGQISQMQGSSKSKEPDYYTGNVSDDTLVKRLDKAGVEFKSFDHLSYTTYKLKRLSTVIRRIKLSSIIECSFVMCTAFLSNILSFHCSV